MSITTSHALGGLGNEAIFATDPLTGWIGLSVGGAIAPLTKSDGLTCIILGDSITGQNLINGFTANGMASLQSYNPPITSQFYSATQDKGYMSWLQVFSGNAFVPLFNGGVAGQRTDQILARTETALAYAPKFVFELSGTNDVSQLTAFYGDNSALAETTIIANRKAIWGKCMATGARVVALSIPTPASGIAWSAARMGLLYRVNRQLKDFCLTNGILWVDIAASVVDTANTSGYAVSAYYDSTFLHPSSNGCYTWAKAIWAQIQKFVQPYTGLVSSQADFYTVDALSKNILPPLDGLFVNGTNTTAQTGTTGTFPAPSGSNAWLMSRTAGAAATGVASVPAAPSGVGNSVQLVITSTAAEDTFRMLWADGAPSIAKLPAGEACYFECEVKVTSATNLRSLQGSIIITTTGGAAAGTYTSYALQTTAGETGLTDATGFTGVIRTPVVYVPSDATAVTLIRAGLQPVFSGAGGATIQMSRCSIVKV
jgi:hypothetical protein